VRLKWFCGYLVEQPLDETCPRARFLDYEPGPDRHPTTVAICALSSGTPSRRTRHVDYGILATLKKEGVAVPLQLVFAGHIPLRGYAARRLRGGFARGRSVAMDCWWHGAAAERGLPITPPVRTHH